MKSIGTDLLFCVLVVFLYGCAQSAPSRFYTLSALAQPTASGFQQAVSVGPILIPPVVDRPQMVTRLTQNEVKMDEFNRWSVPLQKDIARVIAENLAARLGSSQVTIFPQSPPDKSALRVTIAMLTFETGIGHRVILDAQWSIRIPGNGKTLMGRTTREEPLSGAGYDDRIAAYNRVLKELSEDIAQVLISI